MLIKSLVKLGQQYFAMNTNHLNYQIFISQKDFIIIMCLVIIENKEISQLLMKAND